MSTITEISIRDEKYPRSFLTLPSMPLRLYCRGDIRLLNQTKKLAIIGTRKPTPKALEATRMIVEQCLEHGYITVSGLAYGIDIMAHIATFMNNAPTIAVVPDIDHIYPEKHEEFVEKILETGGLVISENAPGTVSFLFGEKEPGKKSLGQALMLRDRMVSALSDGVIAVQSAWKQENGNLHGTMHTCEFAKKQGRFLFVPEIHDLPEHEEKYSGVRRLVQFGDAFSFMPEQMEESVFSFLEKPLNEF